MRYQGRITDWKDEKGFGFVKPNGSETPIFVHIKSFSTRARRPLGNELVTYELTFDKQSRPQASNVSFVATRRPVGQSPAARPRIGAVAITTIFLGFIVASVVRAKLHPIVLFAYIVASCLGFLIYAFDKAAAMQGDWRTKESTLHLVSVFGGWPGAMIAQSMFRHKTKKKSFQLIYWVTITLNCIGLIWLLSPNGVRAISKLVAGE